MTPEGKIKAMVKREMSRFSKLYAFMPVQRGMGAPALDFYYCVNGIFVAIETKVPGSRLTGRQQVTAREIAAAGGVVFVVRTKADIDAAIECLGQRSGSHLGRIYDTKQGDDHAR